MYAGGLPELCEASASSTNVRNTKIYGAQALADQGPPPTGGGGSPHPCVFVRGGGVVTPSGIGRGQKKTKRIYAQWVLSRFGVAGGKETTACKMSLQFVCVTFVAGKTSEKTIETHQKP